MSVRVTRIAIVCATVSFALVYGLLGGCNGQQPAGSGTVNLQVTDAPFPVDLISEATVTITRIDLHAAASQPSAAASQPSGAAASQPCRHEDEESAESEPADTTAEQADDSTDGSGDVTEAARHTNNGKNSHDRTADNGSADAQEQSEWITVFEGSKTFNLLDLRNGRTDLLANMTIPAGTYTQMRLIVTEGSVTLKDGRTFKLKVPSGEETGIKLHFTFTVAEGDTKPLLLDVNLARAFQPIPGNGAKHPEDIKKFRFRPAMAMRLINVVKAGSIQGTVTNAAGPLASVTVTATRDGTEVTSTTTEADGTYTLTGLPTGTYTVTFAADGYTQTEIDGVDVTAGQATASVDVMLQAEAPASQPTP